MSGRFKVGDYAIVRGATRYKDGPLCAKGWPPECNFGESFSYAEGSLGKVVSVNHPHWISMGSGNLNLLLALFNLSTHYCGERTEFSLFHPRELVKTDPINLKQEIGKINKGVWNLNYRSLEELAEAYQRGLETLKDMKLEDIESHKQGVVLLRADRSTREEREFARKSVDDYYKYIRGLDEWMRESMRRNWYVGSPSQA